MSKITVVLFFITSFFLNCLLPISNAAETKETQPFSSHLALDSPAFIEHDDFFINSIPKAGTHFIMRCITLLTNKTVDGGYDWIEPQYFNSPYINKFLNTLHQCKARHMIHKTVVPYFPEVDTFFSKTEHKCLFNTRDPRDAIISLVFYMEQFKKGQNRRDFFLVDSEIYDQLSLSDKITAVITGS